MGKDDQSVGIVETKYFEFASPPGEIKLESGEKLGPITIAYETYGTLNSEKDNAILICHALSGDAHVAGRNLPDDKKVGWWDIMVGPGKAFNTNKYFVICSNIIGGCKGSTGPASINPKTGQPYAMSFPFITISDMVKVQKKLIDYLGIEKLLMVVGGSMGGMQVLDWAINYPRDVRSAMVIASTGRLSPQSIAFNAVGRNAIISDPNWNEGNYYNTGKLPEKGLSIARMIGHITYLSDESMHKKFGRKLKDEEGYRYDVDDADFQVESYLQYKGERFVERFDANSYLVITKAMDYYDIVAKYGSLQNAFKDVESKFLVVSFTSDWLFPAYQSKEIAKALMNNGKNVSYVEIKSSYGHDAFLLEEEQLGRVIRSFLANLG